MDLCCLKQFTKCRICYFSTPEHWNYFGIDEALGPVAVSLRREKLEEEKELGQQYNYRLIFRTSEVGYRVLLCSLNSNMGNRFYQSSLLFSILRHVNHTGPPLLSLVYNSERILQECSHFGHHYLLSKARSEMTSDSFPA